MFNAINTIKAVLVCALVNGIYTFYISSTAFQKQFSINGEEFSRLGAFIEASEVTIGFWPHILVGWWHGFAISLISCALFLLWLALQTPNKSSNLTGAKNAPSS